MAVNSRLQQRPVTALRLRRSFPAKKGIKLKLAYSINETSEVLGVGRTKIYKEIAKGKLEARKIGKRTVVTSEGLNAYIASLPLLQAHGDKP